MTLNDFIEIIFPFAAMIGILILAGIIYHLLHKDDQPKLTLYDGNAKEYFNGICPYTGIACISWECSKCDVEKAEREFMELREDIDK